jgi:uncharacterized membrane protein
VATLTVWRFTTPQGAEDAAQVLEGLQKQELITVQDAAVVSWPEEKKKPKTKQLHSLTGSGALTGTFWGLLFGLLFFIPVLGAAVGAASGAIVGALTDVGIDDDFIKKVRTEVTPGTSALFALTSDAVFDKVRDAFKDVHGELIQSNLSSQQEQQLKDYFAAED